MNTDMNTMSEIKYKDQKRRTRFSTFIDHDVDEDLDACRLLFAATQSRNMFYQPTCKLIAVQWPHRQQFDLSRAELIKITYWKSRFHLLSPCFSRKNTKTETYLHLKKHPVREEMINGTEWPQQELWFILFNHLNIIVYPMDTGDVLWDIQSLR